MPYIAPHTAVRTAAHLSLPTAEVYASYLEAVAEYRRTGGYPDFDELDDRILATPARFAAYVDGLRADPHTGPARAIAPPMTLWWWVAGDRYLGRISIWHHLDADLILGGHMGFDVRPTARGRGHARAMLAAALPHAHALGIDPAILSTPTTNAASRAVITANGGRPIDQRGDRLYFEIATHPDDRTDDS